MNILYLCSSAQSRYRIMCDWADLNDSVLARMVPGQNRAELKNGDQVYFSTYDKPERLRGREFGVVFFDGERPRATDAQISETWILARSRAR